MDDRSEKILQFLKETVHEDLSLDTELIESGLMDSFRAVTLLAFIEAEFDVRVQPSDLTHADLASARAIVKFVSELGKAVTVR